MSASEDQRQVLVDGIGRVWSRTASFDGTALFGCGDDLLTEHEIRLSAEPVIEIRDHRIVRAALLPVAACEVRLNDWIVLPVMGELSPVIGIWPGPDSYVRTLYLCTENGDWARRTERGRVLHARPPIPDLLTIDFGCSAPVRARGLSNQECRDE